MKNAKEYYENSIKINKPSALLSKFLNLKFDNSLNGKSTIDLGCGAGNDTIFLLKKGFKVTAIDSEPQVKHSHSTNR